MIVKIPDELAKLIDEHNEANQDMQPLDISSICCDAIKRKMNLH